jgi:hypothetical protein
MRTLLFVVALTALTNCAGVKEVTLEKHSTDFLLCIYRYTGKTFLVGHGGFLIREQSKYNMVLPDNKGIISFDKIKIEKNGKPLNTNGGTIKFLDNGQLTISLTKETKGKTADLEINGIFKTELRAGSYQQ